MKSFMPVTLWYRFDVERKEWVFNHLEYGLNLLRRPVPASQAQLVWNELAWQKDYSVIDLLTRVVA